MTYTDSSHDAMLQVGQMFGQLGRFQVIEDQRDFAAMFDARIANGNVSDPVVGWQTAEINERGQFGVVGSIIGGQPTLPIFDERRQFGVQVKVNGELSDPEADGVANGAPEFVDLARG